MPWNRVIIDKFGGPDALRLVTEPVIPDPGPGEVRIRILAAGTGFTDCFIRSGRYPDVKGPLPLTIGYDIVGVVDRVGAGVDTLQVGDPVADLCVTGGYAQYAIRPASALVPMPGGLDPAEAVCIPLAYLTAFQMLTRLRHLGPGATILVVGASGTVGTALLDLARHFQFRAIGTASAANLPVIARLGATAIDYRAGDFVSAVRAATGGRGVDLACDAIGGSHFARSFACLAQGGLLVGYGAQNMAEGRERLAATALGMIRLKLWGAAPLLFGGRRGVFYSITARRKTHPAEFRADMISLFTMLRDGAIHPVVIGRLPLSAARDVHVRIDKGGLGGKMVLLPWD